MPQEQPNITPLGNLPWADPLCAYFRRSLIFSLKATCCALLMFGLVSFVTRNFWQSAGGMLLVYAMGAVQAALPTFRQGWLRFGLFCGFYSLAGAACLFVTLQAHDWLTVDACYDSGGVYLDEIERCSHSQAEIDRYRPK